MNTTLFKNQKEKLLKNFRKPSSKQPLVFETKEQKKTELKLVLIYTYVCMYVFFFKCMQIHLGKNKLKYFKSDLALSLYIYIFQILN